MEADINAYDEYIEGLFAPQDSSLTQTVASLKERNIPLMQVSASQGKLLQVLAMMVNAKRILEIGTLAGYSGIHLARALPDDGQLITFETFPHHAELARKNFEKAGVLNKVKIYVGSATEFLQDMVKVNEPSFDLIFIDANKNRYHEYLAASLPLLRVGGVILADNTLRDALSPEDNGIKQYNKIVSNHPDLESIVIPILRRFGLDGLTVSFKRK